ncbi:hypothetical protein JTE90_010893 [Oedothorax gibbosus]|uniref:Protein adenylyltransferase Fic n=1 Tax=Oedothorax gibbosus TaxID=931172 RepID=A0AAV6UG34_9ARAC|nr:hypothetical protein JTE90_010893 [Oedothorax gibbosus]
MLLFSYCIPEASQNIAPMAVLDDTEALKSLQLALKMKQCSKYEKAKKLMQHAMALNPRHPEVLNHYAELLESENIVEADRLYAKALSIAPGHEVATINRRRTAPVVDDIDQQQLDDIDKKMQQLLDCKTPTLKAIVQEVYYQQMHHSLGIEGNTMTIAETKSVAQTGVGIQGKSTRENNEVLGLQVALEYVETLTPNVRFASVPNVHENVTGMKSNINNMKSYIDCMTSNADSSSPNSDCPNFNADSLMPNNNHPTSTAYGLTTSCLMSDVEFATIPNLLQIHQKVLELVDPNVAGVFRKEQVYVGVHVPPPADKVEALTKDLIDWLKSSEARALHPVKRAAIAHYKFAYIHPFVDGNGRTARLLMNLILASAGYPSVIIRKQDKDYYFETLQMATEGDVRPFVRLVARCMQCILDVYLSCSAECDSDACLKILEAKMAGKIDVISL